MKQGHRGTLKSPMITELRKLLWTDQLQVDVQLIHPDDNNPLPPHQFWSAVLTASAGITGHGKQHENPQKGSFFLGMQSLQTNKCLNGRQSLKDVLVLFPLAVVKIPWPKQFRSERVNFSSQGITVHHHGSRSTRLAHYIVSTAGSTEE